MLWNRGPPVQTCPHSNDTTLIVAGLLFFFFFWGLVPAANTQPAYLFSNAPESREKVTSLDFWSECQLGFLLFFTSCGKCESQFREFALKPDVETRTIDARNRTPYGKSGGELGVMHVMHDGLDESGSTVIFDGVLTAPATPKVSDKPLWQNGRPQTDWHVHTHTKIRRCLVLCRTDTIEWSGCDRPELTLDFLRELEFD